MPFLSGEGSWANMHKYLRTLEHVPRAILYKLKILIIEIVARAYMCAENACAKYGVYRASVISRDDMNIMYARACYWYEANERFKIKNGKKTLPRYGFDARTTDDVILYGVLLWNAAHATDPLLPMLQHSIWMRSIANSSRNTRDFFPTVWNVIIIFVYHK
jgi:hypothetical protein